MLKQTGFRSSLYVITNVPGKHLSCQLPCLIRVLPAISGASGPWSTGILILQTTASRFEVLGFSVSLGFRFVFGHCLFVCVCGAFDIQGVVVLLRFRVYELLCCL